MIPTSCNGGPQYQTIKVVRSKYKTHNFWIPTIILLLFESKFAPKVTFAA